MWEWDRVSWQHLLRGEARSPGSTAARWGEDYLWCHGELCRAHGGHWWRWWSALNTAWWHVPEAPAWTPLLTFPRHSTPWRCTFPPAGERRHSLCSHVHQREEFGQRHRSRPKGIFLMVRYAHHPQHWTCLVTLIPRSYTECLPASCLELYSWSG